MYGRIFPQDSLPLPKRLPSDHEFINQSKAEKGCHVVYIYKYVLVGLTRKSTIIKLDSYMKFNTWMYLRFLEYYSITTLN